MVGYVAHKESEISWGGMTIWSWREKQKKKDKKLNSTVP